MRWITLSAAVASMLCFIAAARSEPAPAWDVYADTWVATDGLGRSLPTHDEVGPPRADRTVGIFYFPAVGQHQAQNAPVTQPLDVTKILAANPEALHDPRHPAWHGGVHANYYWGEPLFGYYVTHDPFIQRKHAQMLADAGVDTLIFDTSNGAKYRNVVEVLCSEYSKLLETGHRVPQFAYLCPFSNAKIGEHKDVGFGTGTIRDHFDFLYRDRRYEKLWFRWNDKPLMLATPDSIPPDLADTFTWRTPIAPYNQPQHDVLDWAWMSIHPQTIYKDAQGRAEEIAVGVAQNYVPEMGQTSPMSWPNAMGRNFRGGKSDPRPEAVNEGLNFQEQWDHALKHDPRFIFVTGWNEWLAMRMDVWSVFKAPPVLFIDLFNQEFSRDAEPMRGGHGDNYYYQLIANVRRYKGVRPIPPVVSKPVTVDANFEDWREVQPEFRDTLGDPVKRDHAGWGSTHYRNESGRNDIMSAKVSLHDAHVHFYIRVAGELRGEEQGDWMILYVDLDQNAKTGWLGYDLRINHTRDGGRASVERHQQDAGGWRNVGHASYHRGASELHIAVPAGLMSTVVSSAGFDFKWADRCTAATDWTDFTLNGDAAPNDRFNYRAVFSGETR